MIVLRTRMTYLDALTIIRGKNIQGSDPCFPSNSVCIRYLLWNLKRQFLRISGDTNRERAVGVRQIDRGREDSVVDLNERRIFVSNKVRERGSSRFKH